MTRNHLSAIAGELAAVFRLARNQDELRTLLLGLLSPRELEEIDRRWHLLERLNSGQTQREIRDDLGVSLGKIARGSRLIQYGDDKFVDVLNRILRQTGDNEARSEE